VGEGAGCGLGGRIRPRHPPPARPARRRSPACVCGAAAASRQDKNTSLHKAAKNGHAPCVESLLKAGADANLKDGVSDGAEGRGGRRGGGSGKGAGRELWGEGPCSLTPRRLSAPPPPPPLPPSPSQDGKTALDMAKARNHTEAVKLLEKYTPAYFTEQVGRATSPPLPPVCTPVFATPTPTLLLPYPNTYESII